MSLVWISSQGLWAKGRNPPTHLSLCSCLAISDSLLWVGVAATQAWNWSLLLMTPVAHIEERDLVFFSPKLTVWGSYKVNNLYSFVCMHFKGWGKKNAKLLSYNMERANISFSHENCLQNVNRLPMWSSEIQISAVPKTFTQCLRVTVWELGN